MLFLRSRKPIEFLFFLFFFFQPLLSCEIEEPLSHLSLEEKEGLHHFFATAIKRDHLGHVLFFSNKPACLVGEIVSDKESSRQLFLKGWHIWQEKERLFPHPNFIIHHEMVEFASGDLALHIYFINKRTLDSLLSKNEKALKEICGEKFSKDGFMKNLEDKNLSLSHEDPALIGFLLGFGMESAKAYKQDQHKPRDVSYYIMCAKEGKVKFTEPTETSDASRSSHDLSKKVMCTIEGQVYPVSFIGSPDSKEVQTLQHDYANELEQIEAIYQEKDLLKLALEALCG